MKTGLLQKISAETLAVALLTLFAGALFFWGLRSSLPYAPDVDEQVFWVEPALRMDASGALNPGWFGAPGSTMLYPLAFIYHVEYRLSTQTSLLAWPDPELPERLALHPSRYYLMGRLLSALYATLCAPLVYALGKRAFGWQVGLMGMFLFPLNKVLLIHVKTIRSDSAALFFGLLALWLCLGLLEKSKTALEDKQGAFGLTPSVSYWLKVALAGLAIGLAISSRYFMAALLPVGLAAIWWGPGSQKAGRMALLALYALAGFALSTPYFFLDFSTVLASLQHEARAIHLGADGLSPLGNLFWYLSRALPNQLGWPQFLLGLAGLAWAGYRRQPAQLLLVIFWLGFLGGISLLKLHWERWPIPIMAITSLFAAEMLGLLAGWATQRLRLQQAALSILLLALAAAPPATNAALLNLHRSQPNTRVQARFWMEDYLPAGSRIVQDPYGAVLSETSFTVVENPQLAKGSLADLVSFNYLVTSSEWGNRVFAEPERYPLEIAFYRQVETELCLLQEFQPRLLSGGPTLRVYALHNSPGLPCLTPD